MLTRLKIQNGDIVTYRSGRVNRVNKDYKYTIFYNDDLRNPGLGVIYDIMKIQRYVKTLCFYRLKTIYEREEK